MNSHDRPNNPKTIGEKLLSLVKWQVEFGPRLPGTSVHRDFIENLQELIRPDCDELYAQDFTIHFQQKDTLCTNIIAVKKAAAFSEEKPLLIGTHFDTRLIADNETDPDKINKPIPGANDGGSGTAIQIALLSHIKNKKYSRDLHFVFFDAEDVGNIDGFEFSTGAQYLADNPLPQPPGKVLVLDMVGGKNLVLDTDMHLFEYANSTGWAKKIIADAILHKFMPLLKQKQNKYKYIICDHFPFMKKGIPAYILIDIDYPQWHTQQDLPKAMSSYSLASVFEFVDVLLDNYLLK